MPAADYKGNAAEAVWLPNAAVAKAWMEYVKTGAVSDTTPPPAPFDVQVAAKDQGNEITWNAEADFESGIGGFIVLRDGEELAKVPPKPVGKFGRPLFQSMTYHDTPAQPLAEMRYLDASAKTGEKHVYGVIEVNSVGLKSAATTENIARHPSLTFLKGLSKNAGHERGDVYTARCWNRQPAKVLEACDLYGQVKIRTRNGKTYLVQAEKAPSKRKLAPGSIARHFQEHRKRLRKLGYVPPGPEEIDRIDRIIAGEI